MVQEKCLRKLLTFLREKFPRKIPLRILIKIFFIVYTLLHEGTNRQTDKNKF